MGVVGRLVSYIAASNANALWNGDSTIVTRHEVDIVEQAEKDVVGEVFERVGCPAGFATKCLVRACWGLTR